MKNLTFEQKLAMIKELQTFKFPSHLEKKAIEVRNKMLIKLQKEVSN